MYKKKFKKNLRKYTSQLSWKVFDSKKDSQTTIQTFDTKLYMYAGQQFK